MGVLVRSASVLSMLEAAGASVDPRTRVAKMPESMVMEALDRAPKRFTLCARDSGNDVKLPAEGMPHLTTDGLALYMMDIDTGEQRNATIQDFACFARLADALDAIDFFWPIVTISDVPARCHSAYELWTAFENCSMHVQGDCTDALDARRQIELASAVAGGRDELRKRPLFSVATNPISPLSFDEGAVEAQVEFAKAGVPVLCHSMSMPG
jgi:trimethylamine--corrinoid protein Co-methyltransferase